MSHNKQPSRKHRFFSGPYPASAPVESAPVATCGQPVTIAGVRYCCDRPLGHPPTQSHGVRALRPSPKGAPAAQEPPAPAAEPLVRYGCDHRPDRTFNLVPMVDGYWTPWHVADLRLAAEREEVATLRAQVSQLTARAEQAEQAFENGRTNEHATAAMLSEILTGGSASTWAEIEHAARALVQTQETT